MKLVWATGRFGKGLAADEDGRADEHRQLNAADRAILDVRISHVEIDGAVNRRLFGIGEQADETAKVVAVVCKYLHIIDRRAGGWRERTVGRLVVEGGQGDVLQVVRAPGAARVLATGARSARRGPPSVTPPIRLNDHDRWLEERSWPLSSIGTGSRNKVGASDDEMP
jgi:hypothetical protein